MGQVAAAPDLGQRFHLLCLLLFLLLSSPPPSGESQTVLAFPSPETAASSFPVLACLETGLAALSSSASERLAFISKTDALYLPSNTAKNLAPMTFSSHSPTHIPPKPVCQSYGAHPHSACSPHILWVSLQVRPRRLNLARTHVGI